MIDFTTDTERKRCMQIDKCQNLLSDVTDALGFGIDMRKATNRLIKLRNYLNKELPDKKRKKAKENLLYLIKEMEKMIKNPVIGEMTSEGRRVEKLIRDIISSWIGPLKKISGDI
jgi:hypothetical protein